MARSASAAAPRLMADRPGRLPARDRHRLEDQGARRARQSDRAEEFERAGRAWSARVRRDGRAVQGDGRRRSRLRRRPGFQRNAKSAESPSRVDGRIAAAAGISGMASHPHRRGPQGVDARRTRASAPATPGGGGGDIARAPRCVPSRWSVGLRRTRSTRPTRQRSPNPGCPRAPALRWAGDGDLGLALGATGADCGMTLFGDQRARVIGAAMRAGKAR